MENSFFDVEAIEIPTPISITFENRCHNCKRAFASIDYSYNYCPYCGEKKIYDTEFTFTISEETTREVEDKNE